MEKEASPSKKRVKGATEEGEAERPRLKAGALSAFSSLPTDIMADVRLTRPSPETVH